jgi:hypothetical protein
VRAQTTLTAWAFHQNQRGQSNLIQLIAPPDAIATIKLL